MKIRLLVLDEHSCLQMSGIQYGIVESGIYKPVKIQVSQENLWGHYTDWEDIEIVFESQEKK